MSSSPSTLLKLELMADGENENTWGAKTNTNETLIENAIAKRQSITVGGVDITLTDTQYADNQARSLCLALTGTISANINLIVPSRSKMYLVDNGSSGAFSVTVKTAAGAGVVCAQGSITVVYCDGTNVKSLVVSGATDATTLGGVALANFARRDAFNTFTKGVAYNFIALTDAATIDIDSSLGAVFRVVLGGNRTITFSNAVDGGLIEFWPVQDATGSRTLTWPANIVWQAGGAPVLSTAANRIDKITLRYHGASSTWYGSYTLGISSGGGGTTVSTITVSGSHVNMDAFLLAGSPSSAVTFTMTIDTGCVVSSTGPLVPAIDFSGFASGSIVALINNGKIMGHGGRGGKGGSATATGDGNFAHAGEPGEAGGNAIKAPGSGVTFNITNASGFIFGGGGGGGGGGVTVANGDNLANGGGGGGGAGAGHGGRGGTLVTAEATTASQGNAGTSGTAKANGTGGTGATGGTGTGGTGGDGGAFGAAGTAGASPTSTVNAAGGALGAAGKAVDLNGGAATFISGNDATHVKGAVS